MGCGRIYRKKPDITGIDLNETRVLGELREGDEVLMIHTVTKVWSFRYLVLHGESVY